MPAVSNQGRMQPARPEGHFSIERKSWSENQMAILEMKTKISEMKIAFEEIVSKL